MHSEDVFRNRSDDLKSEGSSGGIRLVRITREHLHGIAELEKLYFSTPWSEQGLETLIRAEDGGIGFCAVDENGTPLSYAGMVCAADEGEIMNVATHPEARGRGLASSVLSALIDFCAREGVRGERIRSVFLEVRESNLTARSLYTRLGFKDVGRRPSFYGAPREAAIIMRLDVTASERDGKADSNNTNT